MNRLAVDIGGTFTDVVLEAGENRTTLKLLTTHQAPEQAVIEGALELLERSNMRPEDIHMFVHGTTLATNAIIERKGAKTALIGTEGFRDVLGIADESRYNQYDIFIEKPLSLVSRDLCFTVPERTNAKGQTIKPLDEASVRQVAETLTREGIQSVAVALLHAYANPEHERRVRDILLEQAPDLYISLSSEVSPEIREYERTSTTVANAYVQPIMASYLYRLQAELIRLKFDCPLYLVTSGGGLTTLETAAKYPIRLVESGPAGGAILASHLASENGLERVVSFDMGGTTAKICLIDDGQPRTARFAEVDRRDRFMKGSGLPLRIPVVELSEIGAGGGSIASIDNLGRVAVGPESAGSEPGPACYGRGGDRPAVSDANVTLGRLDPDMFAGGRIVLHPSLSADVIDTHIAKPMGLDTPLGAHAILEVVDENMANAARMHAIEHGKRIMDYTLIAFGGGAPLHVARLAEKLSIKQAIVPPNAGVGSAVGFLRAAVAFEVVRSRYMRLDQFDVDDANALVQDMKDEAHAVVAPGAQGRKLQTTATAFMRYVGQGHEIVVNLPDRPFKASDHEFLREAFESQYEALFSRVIPNADVEILTWTLSMSVENNIERGTPAETTQRRPEPVSERQVYNARTGTMEPTAIYWRPDLSPGCHMPGPAIIAEDETTTYVTRNFDISINEYHCIVLTAKQETEGETV